MDGLDSEQVDSEQVDLPPSEYMPQIMLRVVPSLGFFLPRLTWLQYNSVQSLKFEIGCSVRAVSASEIIRLTMRASQSSAASATEHGIDPLCTNTPMRCQIFKAASAAEHVITKVSDNRGNSPKGTSPDDLVLARQIISCGTAPDCAPPKCAPPECTPPNCSGDVPKCPKCKKRLDIGCPSCIRGSWTCSCII